jgi:hypothetical protein
MTHDPDCVVAFDARATSQTLATFSGFHIAAGQHVRTSISPGVVSACAELDDE